MHKNPVKAEKCFFFLLILVPKNVHSAVCRNEIFSDVQSFSLLTLSLENTSVDLKNGQKNESYFKVMRKSAADLKKRSIRIKVENVKQLYCEFRV